MAAPGDRKRVKVYELKNSDWFDRGTGFCRGIIVNEEAKILVVSEDEPTRQLLETKISKDEGYQKQQETLIVWTETNGIDMALSFQEPEGCAAIWDFVQDMQSRMQCMAQDDGLSDDVGEQVSPIMLPSPDLGNLPEIENMMRAATSTPGGREALAKFVLSRDYIPKLIPLVEMAEDLESLNDLHRLCSIMKMLILLNDTAIIEYCVTDEVLLGVVGALEYDPDFPLHKANHRQYLSDESRFKEVVKIDDPSVRRKIHWTYRLQYLKDVVLARILDDPTFGVLNTLIFYHQVEITQNLHSNPAYMNELFGIFGPNERSVERKKDAVMIIQQFCNIAKSIQVNIRSQLYQNFISHGLLDVVQYALKSTDASVRVAGSDTLISIIEHDNMLVRRPIFKAVLDKTKPLTDTLIELLLVEVDLGVKAQMADAIKHLMDPNSIQSSLDNISRVDGEIGSKVRTYPGSILDFIQTYYETSARKLFQPLQDLEDKETLDDLTVPEVDLYLHLLEILGHFFRLSHMRSKLFILSEGFPVRVALLLKSPQKHLKLAAVRFFRMALNTVNHKDDYTLRVIIQNNIIEPILEVVYETMPRNNLLNSACLEFFEHIGRENIRDLVEHTVSAHREKIQNITYVDTFRRLIVRYDQMHEPMTTQELDNSFTSIDSGTSTRHVDMLANGRKWGQGLKELDADEEAYYNGSDDEDDAMLEEKANGASPVRPLVNYPDDEDDGDDDEMDVLATSAPSDTPSKPVETPNTPNTRSSTRRPPERISEKRRREEEEEDELLANIPSSGTKRKSPLEKSASQESLQKLRRKNSMSSAKDSPTPKKIAISIPLKSNVVEGGGGGKEE